MALGIEESLAVYRVRKNSISSNKIKMLQYNYLVYRKGLRFSVLKSTYSLAIFLFEYFFIKTKQIILLQKK
ncbi:hypothetical protein GCM10011368_18430 [Hyunsoonleella pacifica]|nr:hypothetical protein GCM10011368_18430 [Hyunsoonleella pacifica]